MRVEQFAWNADGGWEGVPAQEGPNGLVLYFGARSLLESGERFAELRRLFPAAHIVGCSTGGQIRGDDVGDDQVAAVLVDFETTRISVASHEIDLADESHECGEALGRALKAEDLAGVFILSNGLRINGSELVDGLTSVLGTGVTLTGGLAGDGSLFQKTLVGADFAPRDQVVAAIGFHGPAVRIGHGSAGGWDVFGPRRHVTRSSGNVLFELDHEPALDLYERYLGEDDARDLPGSALLFPLQIHQPGCPGHAVVRTVLAIDREQRSMTLAGDVPEGWVAQLMRGDFDRLAEGAADAARQAAAAMREAPRPGLALMVSCIGRRLLMGQRINDELEAAMAQFAPGTVPLGFYSYGEISPHAASGVCELHNQTMTVTTINEVAA